MLLLFESILNFLKLLKKFKFFFKFIEILINSTKESHSLYFKFLKKTVTPLRKPVRGFIEFKKILNFKILEKDLKKITMENLFLLAKCSHCSKRRNSKLGDCCNLLKLNVGTNLIIMGQVGTNEYFILFINLR